MIVDNRKPQIDYLNYVVYGEILEIGSGNRLTITHLPCLIGKNKVIHPSEEILLSSIKLTAFDKIHLNDCTSM
jgi:hypothetical protein